MAAANNDAIIAAGVAAAGGFGAVGPALQALANNSAANAAAITANTAAIAGVTAAIAGLTATVNANTVAIAGLTASVNALNIPVLVGATLAAAAGVLRARSDNAHDRRNIMLVPVPHAGAAVPAFWPAAGFCRAGVFEHPIGPVDALLLGYGLPSGAAGGTPMERRNALAVHLGTMRA